MLVCIQHDDILNSVHFSPPGMSASSLSSAIFVVKINACNEWAS